MKNLVEKYRARTRSNRNPLVTPGDRLLRIPVAYHALKMFCIHFVGNFNSFENKFTIRLSAKEQIGLVIVPEYVSLFFTF